MKQSLPSSPALPLKRQKTPSNRPPTEARVRRKAAAADTNTYYKAAAAAPDTNRLYKSLFFGSAR